MIDRMTKYSFILLDGMQEEFLEQLQELGVVDITRSLKPVDDKSTAMLERAEEIRRALNILQEVPSEGASAVTSQDPVADTFALSGTLKELSARRDSLDKKAGERKPWGEFSTEDIARLRETGCRVRYYKVAKKKFSGEWASIVPLCVISEDDSYVWFVTVSDDPAYSFPIAECPAPEVSWKQTMEQIDRTEKEIEDTRARLSGLKSRTEDLEKELEGGLCDLDRYLAGEGCSKAVEGHVAVFEGFAPVENEAALTEAFDKMPVLWYKSDARQEDNPPISLTNNKFTRMFSVLTDMYGRPEYDGFDPTPFISVFFLLFFAFCMGDAGYGLVLILGGLFMGRVASFRSMAPLVVTLGIGTTVIGLLFHTFFSMEMLDWAWIPDGVKCLMLPKHFTRLLGTPMPEMIANMDATMVFAIITGVVHLCLAFLVKAINQTKRNGFLNCLGTWGWTLLIVGGTIVGAIALTGVMSSAVTKWVIIVLGVVSALGIFILSDLHRNPLANIGMGLWETYNTATGLLGDVLSYLRLYALGLAGAMLGAAFNSLGGMAAGGGAVGMIGCVLILIIGHVLNIAMAALGAFVHPLRLNFLEFFKNSGYETSRRNYNPLKNTK